MRYKQGGIAAFLAMLAVGGNAMAASPSPATQDSFRIGDPGGVLCQVQARSGDPLQKSMFDRAWSILCRDAAAPIGTLHALRDAGGETRNRLAAGSCAPAASETLPDIGTVQAWTCASDKGASRHRLAVTKGRTRYVAEGLQGYESALRLALRTVILDRPVSGTISVATTDAGDAASFARAQAASLDTDRALAEGYRRNNSGNYAEAAEFFDALARGGTDGSTQGRRRLGEYIVNRALQKSNLGDFADADALFAQADHIPTSDPVQLRLRRNFRAMHAINQRRPAEALAVLDREFEMNASAAAASEPEIDAATAELINAGAPLARRLAGRDQLSLSLAERMEILDAQEMALRGTALRLAGDATGAAAKLEAALDALVAVRRGRVASVAGLRAQTMAELAAVRETLGRSGEAERLLRDAAALVSGEYPDSIALGTARARLAGFLARTGRSDEALSLYALVIENFSANEGSTTGFANLLAPYFRLLADRPERAGEMFLASQTLVRPGLADTQAVLARALSGGQDEAAALFRQSLDLGRDIERTRIEASRLAAIEEPDAQEQAALAAARTRIAEIETDQAATLAALSRFPRFRAISTRALSLGDLQGVLKPDEAYLKTVIVGDDLYLMLVSKDDVRAWRAATTASALTREITTLRESISTLENGRNVTYPFDVARARALYRDLFAPADTALARTRHIIFEPDGALLQLPIDLLVTDDNWKATSDPFDFRGVAWLARRSSISTAVSPRAFRDVRNAPRSAAVREYLGLGSNAPLSPFQSLTRPRAVLGERGVDCAWPAAQWNQPIAANELFSAQRQIGSHAAADVVTGSAFTDTALLGRPDLDQYRVLHFATHGLVAAPRPECPARPALVTSFGAGASDGLLSFSEIFDLRLDADLVILSACDTAGRASIAATREAGVASGGGSALDGLVRAFMGAGGRAVLASHWPAPDDFKATERLIGGLFEAPAGTDIGAALRATQARLMDEADTSHPYYWAGFAVIGDGAQPVLRPR